MLGAINLPTPMCFYHYQCAFSDLFVINRFLLGLISNHSFQGLKSPRVRYKFDFLIRVVFDRIVNARKIHGAEEKQTTSLSMIDRVFMNGNKLSELFVFS